MNAEIYNISGWIKEVDPVELKGMFNELLQFIGFNVISFQEHYFAPIGWTGLWLLAESHLAVHTFPEHGKSYIELSSCNKHFYNKFKKKTLSYVK